ncbi:MAG: hypothetical protein HY064_16540 [Bacteroidetes bacterium]|nr:hypothetical protein [Bacteroidota bacterium]
MRHTFRIWNIMDQRMGDINELPAMLRRLSFFILTITVFVSKTTAETVLLKSDDDFIYKLTFDSTLITGSLSTYEYWSKSISIINKADSQLVQTISTPKNHIAGRHILLSYYTFSLFRIEDINFDGYNDIMLIQSFDTLHPQNIFYFSWAYNNKTLKFERDTTLDKIIQPNFDHDKFLILSSNLLYAPQDQIWKTYQYIKGKLTLIEIDERKIITDKDNNYNSVSNTKTKLIKGKMKLVEVTTDYSLKEY